MFVTHADKKYSKSHNIVSYYTSLIAVFHTFFMKQVLFSCWSIKWNIKSSSKMIFVEYTTIGSRLSFGRLTNWLKCILLIVHSISLYTTIYLVLRRNSNTPSYTWRPEGQESRELYDLSLVLTFFIEYLTFKIFKETLEEIDRGAMLI